jgi:PTS system ascorbate-specific IIA component
VAGILLVTHNGLGDSLVDCVRHVLGQVPGNLKVLTVLAADDPERKEQEGRALVESLDAGGGVLLLADMFGATPCNIGRRLCQLPNVAGVAGVNLPMLLRAVCNSGRPLDELVRMALEGGRDCIVSMNSDLEEGCNAATRCAD